MSERRLEESAYAMGAVFTIVLYGSEEAALEDAARAAFGEIRRLDAMLSHRRPESEWSRINRLAARCPVAVSEELFSLLERCLDYGRRSEGAFDIAVGALVRAWGFFDGEGKIPAEADLEAARAGSGYQHIRLDRARRTVEFGRPGLEIDPGGIGKGYCADRVASILRRRGNERALIACAGSTILGLGAPPGDDRGWCAEVRDPRAPRKMAAQVFLRDKALSTSGDGEKRFHARGRTYSHLLDPRTGCPANACGSVSVLAGSAADSEAWAKIAFIQDRTWLSTQKPEELRIIDCRQMERDGAVWL